MWSLLGTSLSTLLFVHSLLSLSLFCSHLSLFLSLAVILLFDFYPVESGLYLWQCSCRQMLTHSRPRWGIIQKQSSRFAQRLHTQTHRDGCPACLGTESCLTAHESMHTHLHSLTVFLVRYNPPSTAVTARPPEQAHWPPPPHTLFHLHSLQTWGNTHIRMHRPGQDRTSFVRHCEAVIHLLLEHDCFICGSAAFATQFIDWAMNSIVFTSPMWHVTTHRSDLCLKSPSYSVHRQEELYN